MPLPVVFSPDALDQLNDLEAYIAEHSYPERAARYSRRLTSFCHFLGVSPRRGLDLGHLRKGLRSIGFERRVEILFEVSATQVAILGIYYGGRQPGPNDLNQLP